MGGWITLGKKLANAKPSAVSPVQRFGDKYAMQAQKVLKSKYVIIVFCPIKPLVILKDYAKFTMTSSQQMISLGFER